MKKHSHYYSEFQESELKKQKISIRVRGVELKLVTGSGTFSKKKIDKGTVLLIENAIVEKGWKVLDLGCGYGIVGISIVKSLPECGIVMVDINKRAVSLAKENANLNNVSNVKIFYSDIFSKVDEKFNTILLNPPQTAGREVCFSMISGAKEHLVKGGSLQIVARHQVGGRVLSEKMLEVFGNMQEIAKGSGYRVYISEKH